MVLSKNVLLVEDDADLLEYAEELLIQLGYQVFPAETGEQAAKVLKRNVHLDLLLSDIRLPGSMDGVELAQKAIEQRPNIKVLLVSGYDEYFLKNTIQNVFSFIEKPYRPADLDSAIKVVLGGG